MNECALLFSFQPVSNLFSGSVGFERVLVFVLLVNRKLRSCIGKKSFSRSPVYRSVKIDWHPVLVRIFSNIDSRSSVAIRTRLSNEVKGREILLFTNKWSKLPFV